MSLHKLYVYLILVFKLLGNPRCPSILSLYFSCIRRQGSSRTLNLWKSKEKSKRYFLLTNCMFPFTFGLTFFSTPSPLPRYVIPFPITHQPLFFCPASFSSSPSHLDPLRPFYALITLPSWQTHETSWASPHPQKFFFAPRAYPSPWRILYPFSILFPDPFASHLT